MQPAQPGSLAVATHAIAVHGARLFEHTASAVRAATIQVALVTIDTVVEARLATGRTVTATTAHIRFAIQVIEAGQAVIAGAAKSTIGGRRRTAIAVRRANVRLVGAGAVGAGVVRTGIRRYIRGVRTPCRWSIRVIGR
jgi:hypothetical protein